MNRNLTHIQSKRFQYFVVKHITHGLKSNSMTRDLMNFKKTNEITPH